MEPEKLTLARIGHAAYVAQRKKQSNETNVPAFDALPPEAKNAFAEFAQAVADEVRGKAKASRPPDPPPGGPMPRVG